MEGDPWTAVGTRTQSKCHHWLLPLCTNMVTLYMSLTVLQCVPKFPRQLCYPFSQLYVDESQKPFDLQVAHIGGFDLAYQVVS